MLSESASPQTLLARVSARSSRNVRPHPAGTGALPPVRAVEDRPQRQVLRKKLEAVHDTRGRKQEIARPERHALVADDIRSPSQRLRYKPRHAGAVAAGRCFVAGRARLRAGRVRAGQRSAHHSGRGLPCGPHRSRCEIVSCAEHPCRNVFPAIQQLAIERPVVGLRKSRPAPRSDVNDSCDACDRAHEAEGSALPPVAETAGSNSGSRCHVPSSCPSAIVDGESAYV